MRLSRCTAAGSISQIARCCLRSPCFPAVPRIGVPTTTCSGSSCPLARATPARSKIKDGVATPADSSCCVRALTLLGYSKLNGVESRNAGTASSRLTVSRKETHSLRSNRSLATRFRTAPPIQMPVVNAGVSAFAHTMVFELA